MKIILENTNIVSGRFTGVAKVMKGQTILENYPITARSKIELDNTLRNLLAIHEALPIEFVGITDGEYIIPTPELPPEPEPLTVEELKKIKIQIIEAEIANAVQKAKAEKEAELFAMENPDIAEKIALLNAAKEKEDIKK